MSEVGDSGMSSGNPAIPPSPEDGVLRTSRLTPSMVTETKRAAALVDLDVLADGAIVWHTSHQLDWFYVKAIRPDGTFVTRRYRHDQRVRVQGEGA